MLFFCKGGFGWLSWLALLDTNHTSIVSSSSTFISSQKSNAIPGIVSSAIFYSPLMQAAIAMHASRRVVVEEHNGESSGNLACGC